MMTIWLSVLLSLAVLQGAGQQPSAPDPAHKGEIRGRVTDKDSGQPLARAIVRLHRPGAQEAVAARTDEAGLFRFAGLADGQYDGLVEAGEFRATHLMQSLATASGPHRPIVVKDGEVREVNVALPRARAINVRIVDPWGDPLSGLRVMVKSADSGRGLPFPWTQGTDDHGRLRIFGLEAGRYIVCAETDALGFSDRPDSSRRREGLLRTCYPSAADEVQAEVVRLDRPDTGELEIRMRRGRTFRISGRILDASGSPASGAFAGLGQFWSNGSSSRSVSVDAEGRFALTNVHPGEYAIQVSLGGPDRPEQRRPLEVGFLPVRVEADDLEDLVVFMKRGVDVAGRITLEDATTTLPPVPGSGLLVFTRLADDRLPGSGSMRSARVSEDRIFTLSGIFGRRTLEVVNVPRGWYVKSIRHAGKEIIDEPTEFKDNSDPSALEVVLSNRGAVVTGRVVDASGNPVGRALVLMFRGDGSRSDVPLISRTVASSAGAFRIGPARGGEYLLVAVPSSAPVVQAGEWDRVARLAAAAERITLGDLDERMLDLRVVTER